jgi:putative alpha-1,2-mannosidase
MTALCSKARTKARGILWIWQKIDSTKNTVPGSGLPSGMVMRVMDVIFQFLSACRLLRKP